MCVCASHIQHYSIGMIDLINVDCLNDDDDDDKKMSNRLI